MEEKRLFVGIGFSDSFSEQVMTWTKKMRKIADQKEVSLRWIPSDNYHVTLVFLGSTDVSQIINYQLALEKVASQHSFFSLKIRHIGAFPSISQARVIWLGVQRSQALLDLQTAVEHALGVPREEEEYLPHFSLARLRNAKSCRDLVSPFEHVDFGRQEIREITLYQSIQSGPFPVYKKLVSFSLQTKLDSEPDFP